MSMTYNICSDCMLSAVISVVCLYNSLFSCLVVMLLKDNSGACAGQVPTNCGSVLPTVHSRQSGKNQTIQQKILNPLERYFLMHGQISLFVFFSHAIIRSLDKAPSLTFTIFSVSMRLTPGNINVQQVRQYFIVKVLTHLHNQQVVLLKKLNCKFMFTPASPVLSAKFTFPTSCAFRQQNLQFIIKSVSLKYLRHVNSLLIHKTEFPPFFPPAMTASSQNQSDS